MSFKAVRLNPYIAYGSLSGPSYQTIIIPKPNGQETRFGYWTHGRKKWRIKKEDLTRVEVAELEAFFRAMKGRLYGFRMRDWNCYKKTAETLPLTDNTHAQLQFQYVEPVTNSIEIQYVTKPVLAANVIATTTDFLYSPDITLERNTGAGFAAFASGGNWTLDRETGIITFGASQAGNTFRWSGSFDWPVRFDTDEAMFAREGMDQHNWDDMTVIELKS